jgi:hypothetical protein
MNPYQLFIERISRDQDLWNLTMQPKLEAFYHQAMLPELASARQGKSPGIREPGVWVGERDIKMRTFHMTYFY